MGHNVVAAVLPHLLEMPFGSGTGMQLSTHNEVHTRFLPDQAPEGSSL